MAPAADLQANEEDAMPNYKYLIVGGGMAAAAAARALRESDPEGAVGLIGAEHHLPYDRPPLSKGLWKGMPLDAIWRKSDVAGVELHLGRKARLLDPQKKQVHDLQGTVYGYEKLLLATGARPKRLPLAHDSILCFRTVDDYRRLRALTGQGHRFAVVGGGFIGSEIAAALAMTGNKVAMIFPESSIGSRMFPAELSTSLEDYYRSKSVEVLNRHSLLDVQPYGSHIELSCCRGYSGESRRLVVHTIVAGVGCVPNVELAHNAGLDVRSGIVVHSSLQTSVPSIFAAGDAAEFYSSALGKYLRVEHADNAIAMGRMAGQAMAGRRVFYDVLPYFSSELFDISYEAVGELDSRMETAADWLEPFRKGVVYYLHAGRVRGVLAWNLPGQVDAARQLISAGKLFQRSDFESHLPLELAT